jgi:iron complex outermembrane recepter protein
MESDLDNIVCMQASIEASPWKTNFIAQAVRKAMTRQGVMRAAAVPALLAISAGSVSAQVAAPAAAASAPAAAEAPLVLQQITVTATRRMSSLQEVPGTVQSISSSTLSDLGIQAVSDLPALTPGLVTAKAATVVTFLRGVGINSSGFTTEAPVAIYLDGLYMPNPASGVFSFNNIERIEVLKGPQGTLYGRNSTAGLISVVTREPEAQPRMDVSVGLESYNTKNLNFYGSTPLAQNLFLSVSAIATKQDKGWGRNITTGNEILKKDEQGVHMKLLWKAAPGTKITLSGFFDRNNSDIGLVNPLFPGSVGVDGTRSLGNYEYATRRDPKGITKQSNVALKIEQDVGFANFLSLTGYQDAESTQDYTTNGIRGNAVLGQSAVEATLTGSSKAASQEFQLSSKPSASPFDWIVGAFFFRNDTALGQDVWSTCVGAVCAAAPTPTRLLAYPTTRSTSAYADGTYKVFEGTRLTLGVRYTDDKKGLSGVQMPLAGFPNSVAALPPTTVLHPGDPYAGNPTGIPTSIQFPKTTYRAVLAQDLAKDINVYLSFNRGFKSGEYNPGAFNNPPSRPETLDAIELGLKSQLLERRLRLNAAVFNYDYKDMQLRSTAPPAPPGGFLQLNAANATVKGLDLDFSYRATSNLTLSGGFEYLDAKFKTFTGGTCFTPRPIVGAVLGGVAAAPCDLSGRPLPNAPKFSSSLGFKYSVDTAIGPLVLAANDQYRSDYAFVADGSLQNKAYHLVNASATWAAPGGDFDVQVYGKNLGNKYYATGATGGIVGSNVMYPGGPRTVGVTLGYHY